MEILQEFSACSNDQIIIKRKRTKRPRPSSSTSSSGVCIFPTGAGGGGGGGRGEEFHNSVSISSHASSTTGLSTTTEEEEDMAANCLILLARGGRVEEEIKSAEKKESSRKFTKMPTTTIGKVGIYVYECKTCNRAFSSFQALGGHRASHKTDTIDRKRSPPQNREEEEECGTGVNCKITASAQLPNKIRQRENKAAYKIHECAICGSEFGSGQALGGHMRRHRSAVSANTSNNLKIGVISNIIIDAKTSSSASEKAAAANMLVLDLNMPAETEEDDRSEEKFHSPGRKPCLVFSAAALVDCHY